MAAAPVFQIHPDGVAPEPELESAEIFPSPNAPMDVARIVLQEHTEDGHMLLRRWRGDWWAYKGPHWVQVDIDRIRKLLYERLEKVTYYGKNRDGDLEEKPWNPDRAKIANLVDAMAAVAHLDREVNAPSWLSTGESASGLVPCLNGLVDVNTREVRPSTPDYWGTVAIPFEYDPNAGEPVEWLKFLRTLWKPQPDGTDAPEIETLQQWFGYVLSGRLDLQKMLLLVGPPRSGKGTIARILTGLVGEENTSAPTLAGIAQNFGLETSIGKTLMVVGDARLQSQGQEAVVERLLSISGQDAITLDRKNRTAWTGTMQARIMILSNELPKFGDASGAIASRFVILKLEESFLGKEDIDLERRLRAEFPAILRWALDGLVSLDRRGRLTEPPGHIDAMQEMHDLVSPISAFLRDVCDTTDPEATVPFADLYREYRWWCDENGHGVAATSKFSANLKARMPRLQTDYRPRDSMGRKMPRHVRGLRVSADWKGRIRNAPSW